jgi:uncharacterized protein YqgC (DUF456 family)
MDIFLLILAILCLIVGLPFCILPVIPGQIISWIALLLLKFTRFGDEMSWTAVGVAALFVAAVTILDYVVPVWGTKKFGGTRAGVWGSAIGVIVGLFYAPIGLIVGPFLGALIGELLVSRKSGKDSLKAAFGSFLGFLLGVGLKLIVSFCITFYFFVELFS